MEPFLLFGVLAVSVWLFITGMKSSAEDRQVQSRIQTLARPEDKQKYVLREKALESSFNERVLFPIAQRIFDKFQAIIPLSSKSWVKTKLIQAGYQKPHYPKIFLGIQLLTTLAMFGMLTTINTLFGRFPGVLGFVIAFFFGVAGYILPMIWLMQQAKKRQESIQKSLPDFLDLLVICVEAGLGLDTAISKLSSLKSVKTSDYLRHELVHYTKDVGFGKPRKDALLDMAYRTGVDDFSTIVNALVQAYEMGTGVAQTLRVQSDSMRVKRLQKAEEKANKIPVKMVLPIYIFLFPTIFLAIFGPMGMIMFKTVMTIFGKAEQL
jgi:tight adherence protein C